MQYFLYSVLDHKGLYVDASKPSVTSQVIKITDLCIFFFLSPWPALSLLLRIQCMNWPNRKCLERCSVWRWEGKQSPLSNWTPLESFTLTLTPRVGPCHSLLFSLTLFWAFLLKVDTYKCHTQEGLSYAVLTLVGRSVLIVFKIWDICFIHVHVYKIV